jgi:REP element-mobilizing transposase RayT
MKRPVALVPSHYYHVYNRGNNGENLFREARNYHYFLELYAAHIEPVADTFAFCLLKNHFHLLVRIKAAHEPSQAFSNLFNAYTKTINKAYARTGSLFQKPFQRLAVANDSYFLPLIFYIHFNPQKHGLVTDFRDWPYSSYHTLGSAQPTHLDRAAVLGWFGDAPHYEDFHRGRVDELGLAPFITEGE